jgi:membrane fusion protein (multidrug efflux system)
VSTVQVHSEKHLERTVRIPSELTAFREVAIHPKVQGFVKMRTVDRGSAVKQGQVLIEIVAPELEANYQESLAKLETAQLSLLQAQSNVANFKAQKDEAEAKVEAEEANYKRIQYAAQTAGAIAPVDLEAAEKTLQGSRAHVRAAEQAVIGAQSELESQKGRIRSAKQALISMGEMRLT